MIAFEVFHNGRRVCRAGAEDLGVLHVSVAAGGNLGNKVASAILEGKGAEIHYHVGGLTARKDPKTDVHLNWKSVAPLKIGDTISVKILESDTADKPSKQYKRNKKRKQKK